ncbi:TonB family C-terminal domain-containing protein [Sphingomonas guangdongensis]|uniref:TonB family C-terminal domain-containing protein n=1 Tax=Sphingomonas guangdongensis TaxID=1141890 RepID=A0A285QL06_9SPHN|nr:energy transducer TonB [Sphingomonas guangdongensis]SOB80752.1 TonB family C-terminal domain-containing protein [Sphingomonas guangdongensis]
MDRPTTLFGSHVRKAKVMPALDGRQMPAKLNIGREGTANQWSGSLPSGPRTIADDPFASKDRARPAEPVGNPAMWVSADDYPPAAIRGGEEGRVQVVLTVDRTGRVGGCDVKAPSGSALLDQAMSSVLTRRARFRPALGDDGKPTEGRYERTMIWALPQS